jgi:hypothetical protein
MRSRFRSIDPSLGVRGRGAAVALAATIVTVTLATVTCGGTSPTTPGGPGSGSSLTIRFVDDSLAAREGVIRRELEGAFELASRQIAIDGLEIVVDATLHVIPGWGVGGSAPAPGRRIEISLAPSLDEPTLVERLPSIAAHELHHAARHRTPVGYGTTLLEAMVSEGLADQYASELYGRPLPPWVTALSDPEIARWLERALPELDSPTYDHGAWFFGSGSIPRWAGYTIGLRLVSDYIAAHPGSTAVSLVGADADLFKPPG